jgi:hypothetical protein
MSSGASSPDCAGALFPSLSKPSNSLASCTAIRNPVKIQNKKNSTVIVKLKIEMIIMIKP